MNFLIFVLIVFCFIILLVLYLIKSDWNLKSSKPPDVDPYKTEKRHLTLRLKNRRNLLVTKVFIIGLIVILGIVLYLVYETQSMTYLTKERYDSRMKDTFLLGVSFFMLVLIFTSIYYLLVTKTIRHQSQVIHSLHPKEYEKLITVFKPVSNLYKILFPLMFNDSHLYVFKVGRTLQIDLTNVTKVNIVQNPRAELRIYYISITGAKFYRFEITATPGVLHYLVDELNVRGVSYK